jgi:hypothetical protein
MPDDVTTSENRQCDKRLTGRYPISLEVQYKLIDKRRVERIGFGRTLNISSGGLLFEPDHPLPAGGQIELAMKWPILLQGTCCLKLVMRGRIVRRNPHNTVTAVRAESHEFRTAGVLAPKTMAAGASLAGF